MYVSYSIYVARQTIDERTTLSRFLRRTIWMSKFETSQLVSRSYFIKTFHTDLVKVCFQRGCIWAFQLLIRGGELKTITVLFDFLVLPWICHEENSSRLAARTPMLTCFPTFDNYIIGVISRNYGQDHEERSDKHEQSLRFDVTWTDDTMCR